MNQRVRSGLFAIGIGLSLVGAVVTAHDIPDDPRQFTAADDGLSPAAAGAAGPPAGGESGVGAGGPSVEDATGPDRSPLPIRSTDPAEVGVETVNQPVAVRIGQIGLEASVIPVGVDDQQQFAVPAADTVGWYKFGSAPGERGSTVLAAHVDFAGRRGAFFNLNRIEVGETLEVELADGNTIRYRVVDNVLYDKEALPADDLFRKEGDGILRLITCGGSFDSLERSYRGNVVVTAIPEQA